ncbi:MAG: phosphatidate cytidylyltransferase [Saprospiraceae bacterium]|nr:phosphatidate cytidylyltransferase [Saprospiraceae bacterium]
MSNFFTRTLTGIAFVAVMVFSICWNQFVFISVFQLIVLLGIWEFYKMVETNNVKPQKLSGLIIGSIVFLLLSFVSAKILSPQTLLFIIPAVLFVFIIELYRKTTSAISNISYTILGIIYVAFPLALLNFFFNPRMQAELFTYKILLGYFIILWLNDTFAYIFGKWLGKNRLFERISPKKSWEGSIWGAIISLIVAYVISLFFIDLSMLQWLGMAAIIVVFGSFGDLVESMFKRNVDIKDSGNILPGHGGILDRFDGVLFSAPFVFVYLTLIS